MRSSRPLAEKKIPKLKLKSRKEKRTLAPANGGWSYFR